MAGRGRAGQGVARQGEELMTQDQLLNFEQEIAADFAAAKIKSPIHLGGGNEKQLIEIFKAIKPDDWVLCGWRSHYHCLLKGVPRAELKAAILDGRSVSLCFAEYKILSSGIMGGIAPIAVGLAWTIKRRRDTAKVWCFLGDMAATSGIVHEARRYSGGYNLPVEWIVEDNGLSVCTDTQMSWGGNSYMMPVKRYQYKLTRPHSGIGQWVKF
jgi:TPP-dependent pyruvate/acetoin dehydrogenase alpha subunit